MSETTPTQSQGVRLQDLRDFTVRICHPESDETVGTGVAISAEGKVVTCAHVVEEALGVHPREALGAQIGVYFGQARGGEEKARQASVAACFCQHDDDVVLLQLIGGPPPLGPEQFPRLGRAEHAVGHDFRSYGYAPLGPYVARYVDGKIMGPVEIALPPDVCLQEDLIELRTQDIRPGISGAAVLDASGSNLVVGIVSERWDPAGLTEDNNVGWAVNACVLSLEPLGLDVQDEPYPMRPAPQPRTDVAAARAAVAPDLEVAWNNAPPPVEEWVGREELLAAVTRDWANPERSVTGLIGFGGEGKSTLARRWLDDLLSNSLPPLPTGEGLGPALRADASSAAEGMGAVPTPDGAFWWGFYTRPSVDEFFEAALGYMSGGRIDPRRVPSASLRAQVIGAMLGAGRYLFVLDGLEVMQHQEGDSYGLLRSNDLRDFLQLFCAPGHQSFCLVTSRAPLLDLMSYTTYVHRDVTRLSAADGRALLRRLGVGAAEVGAGVLPPAGARVPPPPRDAALDQIVADWDGHALTLGLLGAYLVERHGGDVRKLDDLPPPVADEPRYERVHRVLRRYDEHLTDAERAFLTLFSAFRTPVHESAFAKVFRATTQPPNHQTTEPLLNAPIAALTDAEFQAMIVRLTGYRILRHDPREDTYTAHPLVRNHYLARLTAGGPSLPSGQAAAQAQEAAQLRGAHERIKDYYLELAGDTPRNPTLDDLAPLIEVVHHACRAGAYDEAIDPLYWRRIHQGEHGVLTRQLGAYESELALMLEFFPTDDTSQEPQVSSQNDKRYILNQVGLCLMNLGRVSEASPFYERHNTIALGMEDWNNASRGYVNLAQLHAYLGELAASANAAAQALALIHREENKEDECDSICRQATTAHLQGNSKAAGTAFGQAEALEREIDSTVRYLYSLRGIQHADYLRRAGDPAYARRVTEANLEICERNRWALYISRCRRVLGDLDAGDRNHEGARAHYDQALQIARGITYRPALIEALLARGRWAAQHLGDAPAAFSDLNEALSYALDGGYRIYEADTRVALAWAHLAAARSPRPQTGRLRPAGEGPGVRADPLRRAREEADRAHQLSEQMGYHWGRVDAEEVLAALEERG